MQCCQTLRTQVLSNIQSTDLNLLDCQLHRLQQVPWTSLPNDAFMTSGNMSAEAQQTEYANTLMKPCMYMARIELVYEVNP
jgi:hypothetical protein